MWVYDFRELPIHTGGNVYYSGARPGAKEQGPTVETGPGPGIQWVTSPEGVNLRADFGTGLGKAKTALVTTSDLGQAKVPGVGYENADGTALKIDGDFFGKKRQGGTPTPGPFEGWEAGKASLKLR